MAFYQIYRSCDTGNQSPSAGNPGIFVLNMISSEIQWAEWSPEIGRFMGKSHKPPLPDLPVATAPGMCGQRITCACVILGPVRHHLSPRASSSDTMYTLRS